MSRCADSAPGKAKDSLCGAAVPSRDSSDAAAAADVTLQLALRRTTVDGFLCVGVFLRVGHNVLPSPFKIIIHDLILRLRCLCPTHRVHTILRYIDHHGESSHQTPPAASPLPAFRQPSPPRCQSRRLQRWRTSCCGALDIAKARTYLRPASHPQWQKSLAFPDPRSLASISAAVTVRSIPTWTAGRGVTPRAR